VDAGRRGFLTQGARKAAELAVQGADARLKVQARRWIRPPFALDELEFLLACTRCGDCVEACPHRVIFLLSSRLGAKVTGTPALDLLNRGCHLCEDWPCVAACEPGALGLPQTESDEDAQTAGQPLARPLPELAEVEIDARSCLPYLGPECGGCAHSCPVEGALIWDQDKPCIVQDLCVGCALCREACIVTPKAITVRSPVAPGA